jgi:hypothetical protein
MKIKCDTCQKEIDSTSIWLCRRNNVDYCNSCVRGRVIEQLTKELKELKKQYKYLLELREFDANIEHNLRVENMKLQEKIKLTLSRNEK